MKLRTQSGTLIPTTQTRTERTRLQPDYAGLLVSTKKHRVHSDILEDEHVQLLPHTKLYLNWTKPAGHCTPDQNTGLFELMMQNCKLCKCSKRLGTNSKPILFYQGNIRNQCTICIWRGSNLLSRIVREQCCSPTSSVRRNLSWGEFWFLEIWQK